MVKYEHTVYRKYGPEQDVSDYNCVVHNALWTAWNPVHHCTVANALINSENMNIEYYP
jgi:hypothetical protein